MTVAEICSRNKHVMITTEDKVYRRYFIRRSRASLTRRDKVID